jgi:hypothetical protein
MKGSGSRPAGRADGGWSPVLEADRAPVYGEAYLEVPAGARAVAPGRPGAHRKTPEYVRWVQRSLNQLMSAGLAVDGISGPLTRAAIRRFQARFKLLVDGVVGPQSEAALLAAGAPPPPAPGASSSRSGAVFLPSWRPPAAAAAAGPGQRTCCLLAPTLSPFAADSNLADPAALGTHGGGDERVGLVYTGGAGFIDLGHLRDLIDLTRFVYDRLATGSGSPALKTSHGEAIWDAARLGGAPAMRIKVARAIAYDDSIGYEIFTYSVMAPGFHNSAFSPEDLCSNYLGTLIAERAILGGARSFQAAATAEIGTALARLQAQPVREALRAFNRIARRWVDFTGVPSLARNDYLRRRNFSRYPWKAGHPGDIPTPGWVTADLGPVDGFYNYAHTLTRVITRSDFPAEVAAIRGDASRRYGPDFDKP